MKSRKKDPIDWQFQPTYKRHKQLVLKDAAGRPMIVGDRLRGTQTCAFGSVKFQVRASAEIPSRSERSIEVAKREIRKALQVEAIKRADLEVTRCILIRADALANEAVATRQKLAESSAIVADQLALARATQTRSSLTLACLLYMQDEQNVDASIDTRRIYDSYIRNHIAVPTHQGGTAIGDLDPREIEPAHLERWERSLYRARQGFRLKPYTFKYGDRKGEVLSPRAVMEGTHLEADAEPKAPVTATTADKILDFMRGVVNYVFVHHRRIWGAVKTDALAKYSMKGEAPNSTKVDPPRRDLFDLLVAMARQHREFRYMIPFMCLVRNTFRPEEARGLRWIAIGRPFG